MGNLLVVDWDFFFPDLAASGHEHEEMYDWGHKETSLYINMLWDSRASMFLARNLPLPQVNDDWQMFWSRFKFAPNTKLFFGESNSYTASPLITDRGPIDHVFLFDAHHDSGYNDKRPARAIVERSLFTCEDWMLLYWALGCELQVVYPTWKTWAFKIEGKPKIKVKRRFDSLKIRTPVFDTVFVCRSGAWVPSWCDEKFGSFLELAPFADSDKECLDSEGLPPREFDLEQVKAHGRLMQDMIDRPEVSMTDRFLEWVEKAENGDEELKATLEKLGAGTGARE